MLLELSPPARGQRSSPRPEGPYRVDATHYITFQIGTMGFDELRNCVGVLQHRKCLLKRLEILRTDEDRRRRPVACDDYPFVVFWTGSMNCENRFRTVRKDSLLMATIVPPESIERKGHAKTGSKHWRPWISRAPDRPSRVACCAVRRLALPRSR